MIIEITIGFVLLGLFTALIVQSVKDIQRSKSR